MFSEYIYLTRTPRFELTPDVFGIGEREVRARWNTLVRNEFLSVDAGLRLLLGKAPPGAIPIQVGEQIFGPAVGRVVYSEDPSLTPNTLVIHGQGWRQYAQGPADLFTAVQELSNHPPSHYLTALGMPGFAAWYGLTKLAQLQPNETVLITAAGGGVGTLAAQIAKHAGAGRVIGSTSSRSKARFLLDQLDLDGVIAYEEEPVQGRLSELAPDGIDVFFDNVSGPHYTSVLQHMNQGGRIVQNGALALYEAYRAALHDPVIVTHRGLTIYGLYAPALIAEWRAEFIHEVTDLLSGGRLKVIESVRNGLGAMPSAFVDMLHGRNLGKVIVRLA